MPADPDVDHLLRRMAELEERVRALESRDSGSAETTGWGDAANPDEPSAHVRELIAAGHKIEAIKAYREETGAGLKEAKKRVEQLAG